jgi:hypothetical protein
MSLQRRRERGFLRLRKMLQWEADKRSSAKERRTNGYISIVMHGSTL